MYIIWYMVRYSNVSCGLHEDMKYNRVEAEGPQILLKLDAPL